MGYKYHYIKHAYFQFQTMEEILSLAENNYRVNFQIFNKVDVIHENKSPLYKYLQGTVHSLCFLYLVYHTIILLLISILLILSVVAINIYLFDAADVCERVTSHT